MEPKEYFYHVYEESLAVVAEARANCKRATVSGILSPEACALLQRGFEEIFETRLEVEGSSVKILQMNGVTFAINDTLPGATCVTAYREATQ